MSAPTKNYLCGSMWENDKARMTKTQASPNQEARMACAVSNLSFIRHSAFGIRQ